VRIPLSILELAQMNTKATLLHYEKPTPSDVRLRCLAEFLGVQCTTTDTAALNAEFDRTPDHQLCILTGAGTLLQWCRQSKNCRALLNRLRQKSRFLFVYGFSPESDAINLAAEVTDGQISGLRRFEGLNLEYDVAGSHPELTKEFSGLSFGPIQHNSDFGFVLPASDGNIHPLISIARLPFWVLLEKGGCTTFLLACNEIVDIEGTIYGDLDVLRYFSRLMPAAMFLKWVFKRYCWHSEHRFANFMIDDPLLRESYGYLNYRALLTKMGESNFATTIAFIPWNYRRTETKTAQLFRDNPDKLSLCIHGCNHTGAEFASKDVTLLNCMARLASERMNAHRTRTGVEHVPVMVFPQGNFSREALKVLKCNNYLAAVNSHAAPSGSKVQLPLPIREFLEPAITGFGGVPLYVRRYPGELVRFAFDSFFGKPLLVVEHHAYLKDKGRRLIDFIARLNSLTQLKWRRLGEIVENTTLQKEISSDTVACKLYSNSQLLKNTSRHSRLFLITKSHDDGVPVETVLVNGRAAEFTISGDAIQLPLEIAAHASAKVNIVYENFLPCAEAQRSFSTATQIWIRRMLSEFRDNVLWKSDFLMSFAQVLNQRLFGERMKSFSSATTGEKLI
jgi:hypothetical protein